MSLSRKPTSASRTAAEPSSASCSATCSRVRLAESTRVVASPVSPKSSAMRAWWAVLAAIRSSSTLASLTASAFRSSSSPDCGSTSSISARAASRDSASRSLSRAALRRLSSSAWLAFHRLYSSWYAARGPARWSPANLSRASRWAVALLSRIWSDWPCTTTNDSPISARTPTGAARPPRKARLRPSAPRRRARISSAPPSNSSVSAPASRARAMAGCPASSLSTASAVALFAPLRTAPASERAPSNSPTAVTTIVLPAPVSPVTTLSPGPSGSVASVMTPRSRILSSSSMDSLRSRRIGIAVGAFNMRYGQRRHGPGCPHNGDRAGVHGIGLGDRAAPAVDGQLELADQPCRKGRLVGAGQADRGGRLGHFHPRARRQVHGAPAVAPQHPLGVGAAQHLDGEPGPGRHDKGLGEERVGTDRHDHQSLHLRPDHGSTGGERVSRGARGGGQHNAVGAKGRQRALVHFRDDFQHAFPVGFFDGGFV